MDRRKKGSITVEAALLLPLVLMILMGLLSLIMVQYDKTVLMACLDRCLTRASVKANLETDWESGAIDYEEQLDRSMLFPLTGRSRLERELKEEMLSTLQNEFCFLLQVEDVNVKAGLLKVTATVEVSLQRGFLQKLLLPRNRWEKSRRILRPEEMVRAFGELAYAEAGEDGVPEEGALEQSLEQIQSWNHGG